MKRILILGSIVGLLTGTTAWAGSLTVPNTFQGGQKALASEVNANFTAVETEVNNNTADISKNAADISSNADSITQNAADIASNAASIADVKTSKLNALTCSDGQVLKYNAGTSSYECADDLDTTNSDALTLEGRSASDFADSTHAHRYTQEIVARSSDIWRLTGGTVGTEGLIWLPQNSYGFLNFSISPAYVPATDIQIEIVFAKESGNAGGGITLYAVPYEFEIGDDSIQSSVPDDVTKAAYANESAIPTNLNGNYLFKSTITFQMPSAANTVLMRLILGRATLSGFDNSYASSIAIELVKISYQIDIL